MLFVLVASVECVSFIVLAGVSIKFVSYTSVGSGKFYVELTEKGQILSGGPRSRICDVTTSCVADGGPIFNLHKSDVVT